MKIITNMLNKIHSSQVVHGTSGSNNTLETVLNIISDVKNNLTSTDTNKPLSANQGKVLKSSIDTITSKTSTSIGSITLSGNVSYLIAVQVFSTVASGGVGHCLGGYDIQWAQQSNFTVSRSGNTYTFSSPYGGVYILAIAMQ